MFPVGASLLALSRYTIRERLALIIGLWVVVAGAIALLAPPLLVAGLFILVAAVLSFALAASVTRPVVALHNTLNQIRTGEHQGPVPHQNLDDEIGDMARALDGFKLHLADLRQRNVADRLQHEQERIKLVQDLTEAYQSSLTRIIDDVEVLAKEIAREYERTVRPATPDETVH